MIDGSFLSTQCLIHRFRKRVFVGQFPGQTQLVPDAVKLVYKDQSRDQQNVVLMHKWSLYAGSITMSIQLRTCEMRCLKAGGLYIQVVFRAGWTIILKYA